MKIGKNMSRLQVIKSLCAMGAALALSGCWAHDASKHDRVSFSAGNAVNANLEMQTVNPSSDAQYDVDGLGQNGAQVNSDTD